MSFQRTSIKRQWVRGLLSCAAIAGTIGLTHAASASELIDVSVLASTDPNAPVSAYTSAVSVTPGQTVYYEVVAQLQPTGTVNNTKPYTIASPQSSTDGLGALQFTITDNSTAVWGTPNALPNGYGGASGSGASASGEVLTVKDILAAGVPNNAFQAASVQLVSGTFTAGQGSGETLSGAALSAGFNAKITVTSAGVTSDHSFITQVNTTSDPYVKFNPLTLSSAPEPASLGLLGIGTLAILGRRRRQA